MTEKSFLLTGGQLTKRPGWHSWRHESKDAHLAARERYQSEHGPIARRRRATERLDPDYVPRQVWAGDKWVTS